MRRLTRGVEAGPMGFVQVQLHFFRERFEITLPPHFRMDRERSSIRPVWQMWNPTKSLADMNRRPALWLAAFGLLLAIQVGPWWYPTRDGVHYLSIARTIAAGEPVADLGNRNVCVPMGYPLLLSPAFWLGDRPFLALSVVQCLLGLGFLAGVYHWAQRVFSERAVLVTGLAVVNAAVWVNYRRTIKEMAFMCALIWAVNLLQPLARSTSRRTLVLRGLAAGFLAAYLVMVRYSGIVLLCGFGTALIWDAYRRQVSWIRAMALVGLVGVWPTATMLWQLEQRVGQHYVEGFRAPLPSAEPTTTPTLPPTVAQRLQTGLRLRIGDVGRITIPGMLKTDSGQTTWPTVNDVLFAGMSLAVAIGWWRLLRQRSDVLALTLPFYVGLYAAWPFDQGARFLVPMAPLLMGCLVEALEQLRHRREAALLGFFAAHVLVAVGYFVAIDVPRTIALHEKWPVVDRFVGRMRSGDGGVAAAIDTSTSLGAMLELALDRPIQYPPVELQESRPQWIVRPVGEAPLAGFRVEETLGGYELLARVPDAQVSRPQTGPLISRGTEPSRTRR